VAGLYSALNLSRALRVTMICKEDLESCDSMLAQGGICVMRDRDDYDSWFYDTMRAGHGECRAQSVDTMIWSSRDVIADLVRLGVEFDRTPDGGYDYTREGAHSRPRILHHADVTGKEITTKLLAQVRLLPNVEIREHVCMDDLLVEGGSCVGVVAHDAHGRRLELRARDVILATGGVGGLYERSTNFPCLTGDGCRVAAAHGVTLDHMDYVQIHPTIALHREARASLPHLGELPRRGRHPYQRRGQALLRRAPAARRGLDGDLRPDGARGVALRAPVV
jgi:L-aspartate oxidase